MDNGQWTMKITNYDLLITNNNLQITNFLIFYHYEKNNYLSINHGIGYHGWFQC